MKRGSTTDDTIKTEHTPATAIASPQTALQPEPMAWLALALTPGLGQLRVARAVERVGSAERIFTLPLTELEALNLPAASAQSIHSGASMAEAEKEYKRVTEAGGLLITPADAAYPERLREIYDPPVVLWLRESTLLTSNPVSSEMPKNSANCEPSGSNSTPVYRAFVPGSQLINRPLAPKVLLKLEDVELKKPAGGCAGLAGVAAEGWLLGWGLGWDKVLCGVKFFTAGWGAAAAIPDCAPVWDGAGTE